MTSPKITIDQTPTEKIVNRKETTLENQVTDSDGKVYKLRMPDPLDEFDLSAALGKQADNMMLQARAMPLLYVESIDNESFLKPGNYNEIRAALKRLGTNGMKAVLGAMNRYQEAKEISEQENIAVLKK
jgi:hypothetical protein